MMNINMHSHKQIFLKMYLMLELSVETGPQLKRRKAGFAQCGVERINMLRSRRFHNRCTPIRCPWAVVDHARLTFAPEEAV